MEAILPLPSGIMAVSRTQGYQPLPIVSYAHAFQTTKRCIFLKKNFYTKVALKIILFYFFKKIINT